MNVIKRSGEREEVDFNKIRERMSRLTDSQYVDLDEVSKKVIAGLFDGVKTSQLDELAMQVCAGMNIKHPDYGMLAGRLAVSNIQKSTYDKFSDAVKNLDHVLSKDTIDIVNEDIEFYDNLIEVDNDYEFNIFAMEVLKKSYLLKNKDNKIVETPQYMFLRVAIGINGRNKIKTEETYLAMSSKKYIHSTPTLFNAGTESGGLQACYLVKNKEDSVSGIYDTLKECALISKSAGGIGVNIHEVRAAGSSIRGIPGIGDGIVPMLKLYNDTALWINQMSKRKGSIAIYLEPWHADIMDFLQITLPAGAEERRCRDLFSALWISDLFMDCVKNDKDWYLFCPHTAPGLNKVHNEEYVALHNKYVEEKRYKKIVKAKDVWNALLTSITESGRPYVLSKDAANRLSNQKNLGTIESSNLCVAPETPILTSNGYIPIEELKDQEIEIWNGSEWSQTTVRQTGENQKLIKVELSNGSTIECTEYHRFFIDDRKYYNLKLEPLMVEARDLKVGQKLIRHELPEAIDDEGLSDFPYAYTHGFWVGDGWVEKPHQSTGGQPVSRVYAEDKKAIIQYMDTTSVTYPPSGHANVRFPLDMNKTKHFVPVGYSRKSQIEWLAGLFDADGCVAKTASGKQSVRLSQNNKAFLVQIMLMLQTWGINSKVTQDRPAHIKMMPKNHSKGCEYVPGNFKACYQLLLNTRATEKLCKLGFEPKRLVLDHVDGSISNKHFVTVKAVIDEGRIDDTYCFTEPKRNMGMFNGVLLGNCGEILEYSSPEDTACCNLASVSLPAFVREDGTYDYKGLEDIASLSIYNLNKVIDKTYYPTPASRKSNMAHRPTGLGIQGLHDVFFKMRIPFDSEEAKEVNRKIARSLYYGAVRESIELAKKHGPYESYEDSPAAEGKLQFDLHGIEDPYFDDLKEEMAKYGLRNSLLIALMPTASSATILGNIECFEPLTSNIYNRKVLSGEFTVVNKYMMKDLWERNLEHLIPMIIKHQGSVQNVVGIPDDMKALYKTSWEISMKDVIDMAADRQKYICQSQSMNLFMAKPTHKKLTAMLMYGQKKGLKTLMYYLRSKPAGEAIQFTNQQETCESCSA